MGKGPYARKRRARSSTRPNRPLRSIAQVRKFAILDRVLSQEHEELTPTLKIKRNVVYERHGDVFEALYDRD
ncbi:MAG: hypothetical protein M3401_10860 [Actinomycetota bacterium]|nr:hypothetical protein [Actinomycetota bacterium]